MRLKKSLSALVVLLTLTVGCSSYQVEKDKESLPNEVTKQNTMTKVQNNVNEIIDKDYEYVLNNLGQPSATAYYIDKEKLNDIKTLSQIETMGETNLVYLKDVCDEDAKSSALVLQLENKKVAKVQMADYSVSRIGKTLSKSKILINCYTNGEVVSLDSLKNKKLDSFIGMDLRDIEEIVKNKQVSYDAYLFDKTNKSINVYKLDDNNKLLVIFTSDNKISNVKILNKADKIVDEIKDQILEK